MNVTATGTVRAATGTAEGSSLDVPPSLPPLTLTEAESLALLASLTITDTQAHAAKQQADVSGKQRDEHFRQVKLRLAEASLRSREAGKFSRIATIASTVAKAAGIAGGIAAAAPSGGSSLVLTATLMGVSLGAQPLMREAGIDAKLEVGGAKIPLAALIAAGAGIAAGYAGGGATATSQAGASTSASIVRAVRTYAPAVSAGATGTQAYASLRAGQAQYDAAIEEADAREQQIEGERDANAVAGAVDMVRAAVEAERRAYEVFAEMMETKQATLRVINGRRA